MGKPGLNSALDELCRINGVAAEYSDIWGKTQHASHETRIALLQALGVLDESADLDAARHAAETQTWREVLPLEGSI